MFIKRSALSSSSIRTMVRAVLREDLGSRGDATSLALIPPGSRSSARLIAKEAGVLCGLEVAMEAFCQSDPRVRLTPLSRDGNRIRSGQIVLKVYGSTRGILAAERTALNFIQQLSGISTLTRRFVDNAEGRALRRPKGRKRRVRVLDTRKTTPLLRAVEKYAVVCGGGVNHRFGLYDMVLIKDNHLAALAGEFPHPIREAVRRARRRWPHLKIEVECDRLDQVSEAVEAGADRILFDNMNFSQLRRAVRMVQGRARTEASGNVRLDSIARVAQTGVDDISVGALTHSAPSLDFSLEIDVA